ncbi:AI-2E family transporter [Microbacterium sp. C5A9]|nr:AI-2E family transporter [Microbacterium sp. C5A9]
MTPSRSFWTRIDRPFVFGFLVTLGGLAAILLGLAVANLSTVIIYIALALFAALGLDPTVQFLEKRGLSRAISVVVAIVGLIVVAGLVVWMVLPVVIEQIASFIRSVPGMIQEFMRSDIYATLEAQFGDQFESLVTDVQKFLTDPGNIAAIGGGALQVGASIANAISGIIVVLVLTLYFLATLPSIKTGLLRLAPARDRERARDITDQITDSVGGYVMGMVILAFCNAVLAFLLYFFLGLPFPPLMATVAFCITLIPLVGSVLFWIIGTTLALFSNPIAALVFAIVYLVYMQIEAYVITPRVMNRAISIPGSLVVIGALAGGTLLGLLGALVAVPVAASILIIIKQVLIPRQDARV